MKGKNKSYKRPSIRKGDEVIVITGDDKGKKARVLEVYPSRSRVLLEGVNVASRSYKKGANPNYPDGGIHKKELPIHISNVMIADPKTGEASRIGVKQTEGKDGKVVRVRYAKSSGAELK